MSELKFIPVNDERIYFSPYTWYDKADRKIAATCGCYFKIAFTGNYLGVKVDNSGFLKNHPLSGVRIAAYIDGAEFPIRKTMFDADEKSRIRIADNLSNDLHYAIVYLSNWCPSIADNERWSSKIMGSTLNLIGILLSSEADLHSLLGTPIETSDKKILIYGDSIVEGMDITEGSENSFAAVMARSLGVEYGQAGYSAMGWSWKGGSNEPPFYLDGDEKMKAAWCNYFENVSRLKDPYDISKGFMDGNPDAVLIETGLVDVDCTIDGRMENNGVQKMHNKIKQWIGDMRTILGKKVPICFMVSFNFGAAETGANPGYAPHKHTYLSAIEEYISENCDSNIFIFDLGGEAYETVCQHSTDGLHPNKTGSEILGKSLANMMRRCISLN